MGLLALGSVARRELTLASDQDNALAYADPPDPDVDAYFEKIAQDVNAGLNRVGFGSDAFAVIYQVRLEHQAQQVRSGLKPDNLMRPARLAPLARAELREAFNAIGRAQQQLSPVARLGA